MSGGFEHVPSVVAIPKGGLGNQLFIYAAARSLAMRTGRALFLDTKRGYTADGYDRSYRLNHFPIVAKEMPEAWRIAPTLKHPRHKLIRAFNKLLPRDMRSYYAERRTLPTSQLTGLNPSRELITLLGYWQNEAYFADRADVIRTELTPPEPAAVSHRELGRRFAETESVFLHVRRVRYPHLLEASYYQACIDEACARFTKPYFVLLGDDLEWPVVQLNFRGSKVTTVANSPDNELVDIWLMTQCRSAIVANSSFSWWGAWLGAGRRNAVWAPAKPGVMLSFPESWRRPSV